MIGIGKPWILAAVATSSTAGGVVGWGIGKRPKTITLDSRSMWCKTKDPNHQDNPTVCLKYDDRAQIWMYGEVSRD